MPQFIPRIPKKPLRPIKRSAKKKIKKTRINMSSIIPIIIVILLAAALLYKFGYLSIKSQEKSKAFAQQYALTNLLNECISTLSFLESKQDTILAYSDELISKNSNISEEKISELRKFLTAQANALSHILLTMVDSDIKNSGLGVNISLQREHRELIALSLKELYGNLAKQYDVGFCKDEYLQIFYVMHKISGQKFDNYLLNS